ncbi:hypothetical protein SDC9_72883 [bioreactor metagenome]|uniref:Uncharacterized protein n=1 Tax=bioreactor metagenome TaxID=1076179 RepID=A0A644YCL3_9ZZZZ
MLFPPTVTEQVLHPYETTVGQNALLELEQTAVLTEEVTFLQPEIVEDQLVVQTRYIDAQNRCDQQDCKNDGSLGNSCHWNWMCVTVEQRLPSLTNHRRKIADMYLPVSVALCGEMSVQQFRNPSGRTA